MYKMKSWRYQNADNGDGNQNGGGATTPPAGEKKEPTAEEVAAAAAGGAKKPTDEEARLLKEVMQKKDALKRTESDLASAQARLKEFDGIDPAAVRKLIADQTAADEAQLVAKGEYETLKARMADEHGKTTKQLQDQIEVLRAALAGKDKVVDELSVGQKFAQSKLIAEELTMTSSKARIVYGTHFDVVDGNVVAYDKPRGEAGRAPLVDQYGTNVDFETALRKICEADPDKEHLFRSKAKQGAGSESKQTAKVPAPAQGQLDSVSKIGAGLKSMNLLGQAPA
ncbi:DUF6651 domain-containing protein [Duganella sp. FT27W]|uniref:DUF6651 domain-containing protein n=1 Tax=Duganella sp. FT27W TaxID=2654636 RepID=UPI00128C6ED8|nr:DUF6651 domain-containing protein [Duganella sp. FT27W]MPQ56295.1 hypothetical protein [Duganella sp. FT27W]